MVKWITAEKIQTRTPLLNTLVCIFFVLPERYLRAPLIWSFVSFLTTEKVHLASPPKKKTPRRKFRLRRIIE